MKIKITPSARKAIWFVITWMVILICNAWTFYRMGRSHACEVALKQMDVNYNRNYVNVPRDTLLVNIGKRLAIIQLVDQLLKENK